MTLAEIYHRYKNMVYNLALQYVQNAEDAEEIVQDVFLKVHQGLENFRGDAAMKTWVYRITINVSLDVIRSRKRKKRFARIVSLFRDEERREVRSVPHFDHPGVELERKEAVEKLFACLNRLPENQRTAVILTKLEDRSQAEVAEIMNLSVKAVESLLSRAKQNLNKFLKEGEG